MSEYSSEGKDKWWKFRLPSFLRERKRADLAPIEIIPNDEVTTVADPTSTKRMLSAPKNQIEEGRWLIDSETGIVSSNPKYFENKDINLEPESYQVVKDVTYTDITAPKTEPIADKPLPSPADTEHKEMSNKKKGSSYSRRQKSKRKNSPGLNSGKQSGSDTSADSGHDSQE